MGLLCPFLKVLSQQQYNSPPLKIGDTIPDLTINNVVNYKSTSIRLSDFKDKLLIIDFWGTLCIPCVKHLPEIYALQKRYSKDVFFLPVDIDGKWDPPAKIVAFFKQRKQAFNLPSVVADTVLKKLFQPQYMGLYVWIKDGVVRQITDGEEVTADNIERAIANVNQKLRLADKPSVDWYQPFFEKGNDAPKPARFFMRSMLFPYSPNLSQAGWQTDSLGRVGRVSFTSISLFSLLLTAYPEYGHFGNRIKMMVANPHLLRNDYDTDSLRQKYLYTYEALFPPVSMKKAAKYVHDDLLRYLNYIVDSTLVTDSCWVLKISKSKDLKKGDLKKAGVTNIDEGLGLPVFYYNQPIARLRSDLEDILKRPVLNETRYSGNVWLDLPSDLSKTKQLYQSLLKQGIVLTREPRPVEYLVIKDRPDND